MLRVNIGDCRLYCDVIGSNLVPEGPAMIERPVVFALHGGPGFDHATMKPALNPLADVAQLVYYDHRGQGRSDRSTPEYWHLDQWADDLRALIDVLGVEKPIVLGVSFGGFVAQNYAIRHFDRLHKLILSSTCARMLPARIYAAFEEFGGAEARRVAEAFWQDPGDRHMAEYARVCLPLYGKKREPPEYLARTVSNPDVIAHFSHPDGENWTFDYREGLAGITAPTLITAGDRDPITPLAGIEEMAMAIPEAYRHFHVFPGCGHGVHRDDPAAFELMKTFITDGETPS